MDKNEELMKEQKHWVDNILSKYITEKNPEMTYDGKGGKQKDKKLSHPFYMGLSEKYITSEKSRRIMVVGQEASGYGELDDGTADYSFIKATAVKTEKVNEQNYSQKWAIAYLEKQVYGIDGFDFNCNPSPFWNFFRDLHENYGFEPCWNNLDKVYFGKSLSYTAEKELSVQYSCDGDVKKSLLQREIEIADPCAVIFVTGPFYDVSMQTAMCPDTKLSDRPAPKKFVINITDKVNLTTQDGTVIPAYWTYHPNYLNYCKVLEKVTKQLAELINK